MVLVLRKSSPSTMWILSLVGAEFSAGRSTLGWTGSGLRWIVNGFGAGERVGRSWDSTIGFLMVKGSVASEVVVFFLASNLSDSCSASYSKYCCFRFASSKDISSNNCRFEAASANNCAFLSNILSCGQHAHADGN